MTFGVLLCLAVATARAADPVLEFNDVTATAGIDFRHVSGVGGVDKAWITETIGAGAAWLDHDGDGHLDLYLVNGSAHDRPVGKGEPNRLFRGDGKGHFTDVTTRAGVGDRSWGFGVAVGDIDNDGDPDLYVTNLGPNVLYRNNGDGTFTDVSLEAGVADPGWGVSAAFFDMDSDGDLDLYVGNYVVFDTRTVPRRGTPEALKLSCVYLGVPTLCGPRGLVPAQDVLYRNNGDGTFTDVTRESGVWLDKPRYSLGVVTADLDRDGDPDVYVANDSVQNSLWRNDGTGKFQDIGVISLSALSADGKPQAGMGTDAGDYTGDGWLDLVVTNFSQDLNTLYRNEQGRFFTDQSSTIGMGTTAMALSWGVAFHDFDHDTDLDLFIANGHVYPWVDDAGMGTRYRQRNHLFINENGRFTEKSGQAGKGFDPARSYRAAVFADYDDDGDMDVVVTAVDEPILLLRNDSRELGHYLMLRLIGTRSSRDGVGARVELSLGDRTLVRERKGGGSFLAASEPRLHFGLGPATSVSRLEVIWPSGTRQVLKDVAVDQVLTLTEPAE